LLGEPVWYGPLRKPEWLLPPVREGAPLVVVTPAPSLDVAPGPARSLHLGLPLYLSDAIRFSTDARVLASTDPWAGARGAVANGVTSVAGGQVSAGDVRHGAADDAELGHVLSGLAPEVVASLAGVGVRAAWSTVYSAPPPAVAPALVRGHHAVTWLADPATHEPVEGDRDASAARRAGVHRVLAGLAEVASRAAGVTGLALFYAGLALTKAAGSDVHGAFRLQANALAMGASDPRDPVYRLSIAALSIFGEDEAAASRARELKRGADEALARWLASAVRIGKTPEPGWADEIRRLRGERGEHLRQQLGEDAADDPDRPPPPV